MATVTDDAIGRLLSALAYGLILAGVAMGGDAWLLHDPRWAAPELARVGFALLVARGIHDWLSKRAARKAADQ